MNKGTDRLSSIMKYFWGIFSLALGIVIGVFALTGAVVTYNDVSKGNSNVGNIGVIVVILACGFISYFLISYGRKTTKKFTQQQNEQKRIREQQKAVQHQIEEIEMQTSLEKALQQAILERGLNQIQFDAKLEEIKHQYSSQITNNSSQQSRPNVRSIDGMEGHEFERFCANLLRKTGFIEVEVTRGSHDQGVDILAKKNGIKYAIQCKNYASKLSNTPIQEVNAGKTFYNCHVAVVMTNSTFTPGAIELANSTNVLLWDRSVLQQMMEEAIKE